jgi:hypothetical protein
MRDMSVDKIIGELDNEIDINEPQRIRHYLSCFRELIDLIPIAVNIAKKHFPESSIVLSAYEDPEINDSYIILYIRLNEYDDSFIDKLAIAESELLPLLTDKEGWIQMSTDFEPMRNNK